MTEIAESKALPPLTRPRVQRLLTASENYRPAETAKFLGVSEQWLNARRTYGGGPKFVKLGRAVIYPRQSLLDYLAKRTVETTAEADRLSPLPSTTPLHKRPGGTRARTGRPPKVKT